MSQQHDWLFRVINAVLGEVRLVVEDQRDIVLPKLQIADVLRGDDGEFIPRNVAFKGNAFDAAPRNGTAHRDTVQHPRESLIVNVERLAGNFPAAFFAGDGFADEGHRDVQDCPVERRYRTASGSDRMLCSTSPVCIGRSSQKYTTLP